MKKLNGKKLNNKGFTLIELLAVVVILAIVMGIAGTAVLNSINNSRRSALYSAAQNAANNLNTWVTEDAIVAIADDKKLGQTFLEATMTGSWVCLSESLEINNAGAGSSLLNALGLSATDIKIGTNFVAETKDDKGKITADPGCSAIRYNTSSGGYELLLVAEKDGKYYVGGDTVHFAYSRATSVNESISD